MHRRSIVFVLSSLLLATICSAQTGNGTFPCVTAAVDRIPIFTAVNQSGDTVLCNSGFDQPDPPNGPTGLQNTNPVATLDVTGTVNASYYEIGEDPLLSIEAPNTPPTDINPADADIFLGVNAGINNVAGTGIQNTFVGYNSGEDNTEGEENTFIGENAGLSNQVGNRNVFVGGRAGRVSAGGNNNTFVGDQSGYNSNGDSNNIFIGYQAGYNNTNGANDIYIGPEGPAVSESGAIRIGTSMSAAAYIQGISGVPVGGAQVYVNSSGQLGIMGSSLRFKEQVRDMGDSTNDLMKLRPVTFFYKPEYANGEHTLQYGLIAEEVAKVYPELVAYDKDGQPYTVRYQYIATMLLNEVQKQYHRAEAQDEVIKAQQEKIDGLEQELQVQNASLQQRLSRLEGLVRVEVAAAH